MSKQTLKIELTFPEGFDIEQNEHVYEWMAGLWMQCNLLDVDVKLWIDDHEVDITLLAVVDPGKEPS